MTFILDGFETTALVLAHIMLMLGRNPEEQDKVRKEIGSADLTFDQMSELPHLDACIYGGKFYLDLLIFSFFNYIIKF